MNARSDSHGFTLVELLLVLAIIGIISGIAIPTFMGQRKRARVIGDASTNARVLAMMLESRKAETGVYANTSAGAVVQNWTSSGASPSASTNLAPAFAPKGQSRMNFSVSIPTAGGGLAYTITVKDASLTAKPTVLTLNQAGSLSVTAQYK